MQALSVPTPLAGYITLTAERHTLQCCTCRPTDTPTPPVHLGAAPQLLPAPARPCADTRTCADERTAWMRSPTAGDTPGEQADSAAAPPEPRAASCAARRSVASSALRTSSVIICAARRGPGQGRARCGAQRPQGTAQARPQRRLCLAAAASLRCRDLPAEDRGAGADGGASTNRQQHTAAPGEQGPQWQQSRTRTASPQTRAAALYLQGQHWPPDNPDRRRPGRGRRRPAPPPSRTAARASRPAAARARAARCA